MGERSTEKKEFPTAIVKSPEEVKEMWDRAWENYLPIARSRDERERTLRADPKFQEFMKRKCVI